MKFLLVLATTAVLTSAFSFADPFNELRTNHQTRTNNGWIHQYTTEECQMLGFDGVMCFIDSACTPSQLLVTCQEGYCPAEYDLASTLPGGTTAQPGGNTCFTTYPILLTYPGVVENACYMYDGINNRFIIGTTDNLNSCAALQTMVSGDPHVVGFEGSRYNFNGESDKIYALISDAGIEVNTRLEQFVVGSVNGTWMTSIGVATEQSSIIVDRTLHVMVQGSLVVGRVDLVDGTVLVSETEVIIAFPNLGYSIIVKAEHSNAATYLNVQAEITSRVSSPHGFLGQTAKVVVDSSYKFTALEGADSDYEVSSMLAHDFVFSTYELRPASDKRFIPGVARGGAF